ncbi:Uncharacterised protein [Bordetella pertussis]|nr:hypothetical protein [Bordetella pertussis]CPL67911.1 Uncharacterised protein [Bordetella pertussis]
MTEMVGAAARAAAAAKAAALLREVAALGLPAAWSARWRCMPSA